MAGDMILTDGVVVEAFRGGLFKVEIEEGAFVTAKPSGKMQKNLIKILVGDKVSLEISPYDMTKGRIVRRGK